MFLAELMKCKLHYRWTLMMCSDLPCILVHGRLLLQPLLPYGDHPRKNVGAVGRHRPPIYPDAHTHPQICAAQYVNMVEPDQHLGTSKSCVGRVMAQQ